MAGLLDDWRYYAGPHLASGVARLGGLLGAALGTFSPGADLQGAVQSSADTTNAVREGRYGDALAGLGMTGAGLLGMALPGSAQGYKTVTNRLDDVLAQKYPGVELSISEKPGAIIVNKIVVPDAERGRGVGTAVMRDVLDAAEGRGATVALTPSGDFGGNPKRLRSFYKRLGFVENKGRSRDFEISEGMYRVPEGRR